MFSNIVNQALIGMVKLLLGASPRWVGCMPSDVQRIYFANHSSHIDTLALWAALPTDLRKKVRPVAAKDYWLSNVFKRYIALKCLNVVLLEREITNTHTHPLSSLLEVLNAGDSLIIFPEGTRKAQVLPSIFKSGIYHLWQTFPQIEFIPVYLENLHRCMPKGSLIPIPLICSIRFGSPLKRLPEESKTNFLNRAHAAVIDTANIP